MRTLARQTGVTAGLAKKNYVNSWILYAIYTSPLADHLVFKGGTVLSKLYFPDIWQFSEDLDFTATDPLPDLKQQLETALDEISDQSGITFEITNFHEAEDVIQQLSHLFDYSWSLNVEDQFRSDRHQVELYSSDQ